MASVKKLMLIPADEWARLLKKSGEKEAVGTRSVDIPVAEQLGGGERRNTKKEPPVGPTEEENVEPPAIPPSSPSPSSPPGQEEEEGKGKGRGGGMDEEGDARKYMEREDSGKENKPVDMRKNAAGVWRPPGRPADVSTSRKRAWINI